MWLAIGSLIENPLETRFFFSPDNTTAVKPVSDFVFLFAVFRPNVSFRVAVDKAIRDIAFKIELVYFTRTAAVYNQIVHSKTPAFAYLWTMRPRRQ